MYSVVMMMALTTGADMPACHRHNCGGGAVSSCACSGGGFFARLRHHRHRCNGGCNGGCNGDYACSGGNGCNGGYVGAGCSGAVYGCAGGAYGCAGGDVMPPAGGDMSGPNTGRKGPGTTLPPPKKGKAPKGDVDEGTSTGTIQISLPASARLTVDGRPTTSRLFVTPTLEAGYDYYYTFRAEVVRDGQTVAQTQHVAIHRGEQAHVSFNFASGSVASNR